MVTPSKQSLEDIIDWRFVIFEQHNGARYGTYNGKFWKQFMPAGNIISTLHPPKTVPKQVYDMARRQEKE